LIIHYDNRPLRQLVVSDLTMYHRIASGISVSIVEKFGTSMPDSGVAHYDALEQVCSLRWQEAGIKRRRSKALL